MDITEQPIREFVIPDTVPLFYENSARFRHWCNKLERFKATQGVRALLGHVSAEQWRAHYAADEDAFSAVVIEIEKVRD